MNDTKVVSIVLNNFTNDSRVLKQGHSISGFGYDVVIVAIHEKGLAEFDLTELGIKIHRVKLWSKNMGKTNFLQAIKYLELLLRVSIAYRKFAIVHCHDLSALPIGCFIKILSLGRVKIVYDAHEYCINDTPNESTKRQFVKRLVERSLIKSVNSVITVSNSIADLYREIHKLDDRPDVVLNCPSKRSANKSNLLKDELGLSPDVFLLLYQGALTHGRGIEETISFFQTNEIENVAIVFMGFGQLTEYVKSNVDKSIFFYPAVAPEEILDYAASADCGVALIEDSCLSYHYCLPNKLFDYFMAGLPVIVSDLPEMRKIVLEHDVGQVFDFKKDGDLGKAIGIVRRIDTTILASRLRKLSSEYNWEVQECALAKVYERL
jgi:glycosyltransferase involved in cell wall biosynthesis